MSNQVHESQFQLLKQKRFAPFFIVQFLGAMNDNVMKIAYTGMITYQGLKLGDLPPAILVNLIAALFILPFILFSATSGQLADKMEKSKLVRLVKGMEIAFMLIAAVGFLMPSTILLLLSVFLMGMHSTLFGPVKYGYLPQHLGEHELVGGNGLVESGTFVAILIGTLVAGLLAEAKPIWSAIAVVVIAVVGYLAALKVPHSPAADPHLKINWNPFTETANNLKIGHRNIVVWRSMLGISWLWFFGATFLTQFAPLAKEVLKGGAEIYVLLLTIFSLGIAFGSLLCERLSHGKVEIGLVPLGSIGMSVFVIDLYFALQGVGSKPITGVADFFSGTAHWRVAVDLFLLAVFGGLYSVPLYALIQERTEPAFRSRIVATNNILNAIFMIVSALLAMLLFATGMSVAGVLLVTGLLNILVAVYIYSITPEFLMRFLTWMLINVGYRIKAKGLDNIPDKGAALLICNHVSYVDALIIAGTCRRPVRFVMDHSIFKIPVLGFIFRTAKAIPIAPKNEDDAAKEKAFNEVKQALRDGDIVVIFPEGKLTTTGEMNEFRPGMLRILAETPVPVIPTALRGLWGSFFSRTVDGRAFKRFRGLFNTVEWEVAPLIAAKDFDLHQSESQIRAMVAGNS